MFLIGTGNDCQVVVFLRAFDEHGVSIHDPVGPLVLARMYDRSAHEYRHIERLADRCLLSGADLRKIIRRAFIADRLAAAEHRRITPSRR